MNASVRAYVLPCVGPGVHPVSMISYKPMDRICVMHLLLIYPNFNTDGIIHTVRNWKYVHHKINVKFIKAALYLTVTSATTWFCAWIDFNTVSAWTTISFSTATERPQTRNKLNLFIAFVISTTTDINPNSSISEWKLL